jgi:Lipocalin-like domain
LIRIRHNRLEDSLSPVRRFRWRGFVEFVREAADRRLARVATESLVGRWRLVSYVSRADDGSLTYPLGEDVQGSLVYTRGGWMIVQISAGDRRDLPSDDLFSGSNAERAAAFSSYLAYCGSYEVTGDVVAHHVAMCSLPNWVGSEQTRRFELAGEQLVLRTPPIEVGGKLLMHEFLWQRQEV